MNFNNSLHVLFYESFLKSLYLKLVFLQRDKRMLSGEHLIFFILFACTLYILK